MTTRFQTRPQPGETSDYFTMYTGLVPDGNIIEILRGQNAESLAMLEGISEERANHRYEVGKWSIKEVVGHLTDMEWAFTYRAMRFARGDQTPLPGLDQDVLVAGAGFENRTLSSLATEWRNQRAASTTLFESLPEEVLARTGVASDSPFSVRGLMYVIAGHELHHQRVLRERYL